ncbi:hypothetical protein [Flavobacterium eburneipallidum]|uniref:hypothetical protein n=1 Tax=Flavobacterium eburneipallidum TaxID=3003263 RepID=UPI0022AC7DED|nr:hypothetical protein [Flavobacterium eburneipallidum]
MINDKLTDIDKLPFDKAVRIIEENCRKNIKFSLSDIEFILNLEEKELVNIFFNEYKNFKKEDFLFIEKFINENLISENKDFISDLIYFAVDFGLDLNYEKILSFLITEKEDLDCLVLACLEYINMNIKFLYIEEIIKKLEYVIENIIYHQNEQLLASLILYRITYKSNYLDFIQELIGFDNSNLNFLNNILQTKPYDKDYFNLTDFSKKINTDGAEMK